MAGTRISGDRWRSVMLVCHKQVELVLRAAENVIGAVLWQLLLGLRWRTVAVRVGRIDVDSSRLSGAGAPVGPIGDSLVATADLRSIGNAKPDWCAILPYPLWSAVFADLPCGCSMVFGTSLAPELASELVEGLDFL